MGVFAGKVGHPSLLGCHGEYRLASCKLFKNVRFVQLMNCSRFGGWNARQFCSSIRCESVDVLSVVDVSWDAVLLPGQCDGTHQEFCLK